MHDYAIAQPGLQVKFEGTQTTYLDTLDSFELGAISANRKLLKIDVQGHELNVLHEAVNTLLHIDIVLIECSFLGEYENITPSFAPMAVFLSKFDLYPLCSGITGHHQLLMPGSGT